MDILYYSNYCKHSKEILDFLIKNDLTKQLNCLCVDKRKVDPVSGQVHIVLENGSTVLLPPNIHSVPTLMLVKDNYRVIMGSAIKSQFQGQVQENNDFATQGNGEPMSFSLGSKDVMSESFTMFNATVEELSAKGSGTGRNLYNYVSATGNIATIPTPPETYKSEKLSSDITVDSIQQQRNQDMGGQMTQQSPFLPSR
jgi:hypothetical protein